MRDLTTRRRSMFPRGWLHQSAALNADGTVAALGPVRQREVAAWRDADKAAATSPGGAVLSWHEKFGPTLPAGNACAAITDTRPGGRPIWPVLG